MQQNTVSNATSNWIGLWTLYHREVWRFLKVFNQTILAPVVTTLLFLAIFSLALGGNHRVVEDIPFTVFIAPGLIMMAIVQNAFSNTSSSLMLSKVQGVIIDILMPPFSPAELTFALTMGGVTRGVLVGIAVGLSVALFVPLHIEHFFLMLFYVLASSTMLSLAGVLTGIWSQTFDQLSAITNYIITPLAFLSGTFYSVQNLPPVWHAISQVDPFFYMIDGFRYCFTGHADGSIATGIMVLLATNVALYWLTQHLVAKGWRLKS